MPHHETERALPASVTAAKPNIECRNIARFFPPSTWALKNATLSIHEGESVAITGASGSGKSTLLSIIGLLDQPSEGELKILGQNMGTPATPSELWHAVSTSLSSFRRTTSLLI